MATKYNFHLSIYSNCEEIAAVDSCLRTLPNCISQHLLECAIDNYYPIESVSPQRDRTTYRSRQSITKIVHIGSFNKKYP